MAKEKVAASFWQNFESLLLRDDEARWKAIGSIILVAGTCGSIDSTFAKSSLQDSTFVMGALILFMSLGWIAWYCSFRRPQSKENRGDRRISRHFVSRRAWIAQMAALIFVGLLPRAEARVAERKLQQASSDPTNPQNITETKQILSRAKAAVIRISSAILAQAGRKFVIASKANPDAVSAVDAFVDYRTSFLNANASASFLQGMKNHPLSPSWETDYSYVHRISQGRPVLEPYGWAPASEAARLNPLGANANQNRPIGDALLVVKGGSIQLDGMEVKNVVFENVFAYYYGWATSLDKVSFVNCKVRIAPRPNANVEKLLTDILSHQSVTFVAYGPKAPPLGSVLSSAPQI